MPSAGGSEQPQVRLIGGGASTCRLYVLIHIAGMPAHTSVMALFTRLDECCDQRVRYARESNPRIRKRRPKAAFGSRFALSRCPQRGARWQQLGEKSEGSRAPSA